MRSTVVAISVFLLVSALSAGTITSLSPSSYNVTTSEEFITINGTYLGDVVRYSGPAGTFDIPINARGVSSVTAWVPTRVLAVGGTYSVWVLGGQTGDSGPVSLPVVGVKYPKFTLLVPEFVLLESIYREGMVVKYDAQAFGGEDPNPVVD